MKNVQDHSFVCKS